MLDRLAIAAALREIGELRRLNGEHRWKALAYDKAAAALEALRAGPGLLRDEARLREVPGIGRALARAIVDLHVSGRSAMLERLREDLPPGVLQLRQVPHLTLRRIRALHAGLGIENLEQLERCCRDGTVGTVKGFGPAIVARLLAGIEAFRHREERVLLAVADRHAEQLLRFARSLAEVTNCSLAGALRRRTELVDAIDIVVETTSRTEAIAAFVRYPPIVEVTARTASSLSLRLADGVLVRATMATPGTFGAVLVEQTGSAAHVARLGRLAGPGGLQGADEAGVYGRLGLPCIPAELREDRGEIEAASAGRLPDLLVGADIRGLVHCHTVYSDGKHTIAQMAKAADALGMEYLTITDHSPSAHYANGVEPARLQEQWDEIARVQQQVKVLLLRGTESDILADGSLDYDEATLQRFDVVIASIHNRHKMDRVQMTRRLIAAMRNPFFKIWGHPLGRYVGSRPPIDCDVEAVLDAAAESRVAIEVNGDPHRLDLEPHWQRAARCRGLPFVISTDAHSTRQFGNLRYGVDMARRGWLCKDDVLNTRSAREFVDAVRPG